MSDTVVVIVSAFFVIGIIVGIVAVVALSALRAAQRDRQDAGWEDPGPGDRTRWPGDDDDFRPE